MQHTNKGVEDPKIDNPTVFKYADAFLKCHKCGADTKVFENVKGGMEVVLYTTDQHKLILHCAKCDNRLEIGFKEASNPPKEDKKADELPKPTNEVPQIEDVECTQDGNVEEASSEEGGKLVDKDFQYTESFEEPLEPALKED